MLQEEKGEGWFVGQGVRIPLGPAWARLAANPEAGSPGRPGPAPPPAAVGGRRVVLGARPEHLWVAQEDGGNAGQLVATVQWAESLGSETYVYATAGRHRLAFRAAGAASLHPGARLPLRLDPRQIHLFDADTQTALQHPGAC